ncbi:uncharacterized protein LOC132039044 [Lycium ferocissimum]|uniref:uncharacterized protein LOC132039044 n=1 Tax=Lycium ferocissimum TaxID=112874 RepID=UPI0028162E24|nr:uncharacterized protein LOC132039044 [Lycium ferocissimum]
MGTHFPQVQEKPDWIKLPSTWKRNCIRKSFKMVKWFPPSPGRIKLNSDGSCIGENCGGGRIFRDDKGKVIAAYSINLGKGISNWAEAKALQHGIEICINMGWKELLFEADSMLLDQAIQDKIKAPWNIKQIIKWIQS